MLEKSIEDRVCEYARKCGFLAYKFKSPGRRNVPDRVFLGTDSEIFFIEFKRPGEKPRPGQLREAGKLIDRGFDIHFVDDITQGKKIIDSYSR